MGLVCSKNSQKVMMMEQLSQGERGSREVDRSGHIGPLLLTMVRNLDFIPSVIGSHLEAVTLLSQIIEQQGGELAQE